MRVFELAKQLNVPSKDLIHDLKTIGVTVSNHMAALERKTVTEIVKKLEKKDAPKSPPVSAVKKKVLASRPPVGVKVPSVPAEPPKVEKKLILVKRRHSEPLLGPDLLPLKPEEELLPVEELTERTGAKKRAERCGTAKTNLCRSGTTPPAGAICARCRCIGAKKNPGMRRRVLRQKSPNPG